MRTFQRCSRWLGCGLACLFPAAAASARQASLELFDPDWGYYDVSFTWISDDASLAVGRAGGSITRWTRADGFENWGWGEGVAASADGRTIVVQGNSHERVEIFFAPNTSKLLWGGPPCYGAAVSADGHAVAYGYDSTGGEGAYSADIWTPTGTLDIYSLPSAWGTYVYGLSADGQVAAGLSGDTAYRWTPQTNTVAITYPGGSPLHGSAFAVSRDGRRIAGFTDRWGGDDRTRLFFVNDGGTEAELFPGLPPHVQGELHAISDDGRRMVLFAANVDTWYIKEAYIWSPERGFEPLQAVLDGAGVVPPGFRIREVNWMTPDGSTVTGSILDTINSRSYAFIAHLPEICRADRDRSGSVDSDDYDAFLAAFIPGTIDADIDLSGYVDTDDFDAFVLAFEEGC